MPDGRPSVDAHIPVHSVRTAEIAAPRFVQVPNGSELTPQFAEMALEALEGLDGRDPGQMSSKRALESRQLWFNLFGVYGTHFITELVLGGKVIYTKFIKSEAVETQTSSESNTNVEAEAGGWGFSMKMAVSMEQSNDESSKKSEETGGSKITVMGGVPVGDASTLEGFAAWADTVTNNPMPTK